MGGFFMKDLISEKEREKRFEDLSVAAITFSKQYREYCGQDTVIDFARIYNVIISACDDIERYKLYHLEKPREQRSNDLKRAVYYTKWILKFRPISLAQESNASDIAAAIAGASNSDVVLINELFAVRVGTANIGMLAKQRVRPTAEKMQDLLYTFLYHNNSDDKLMAIYQFLYDAAMGTEVLC